MIDREQQPRIIDEPEECFVRMQLVPRGVYVAARIYRRLGMLTGEINGQAADIFQIWHAGNRIDRAAYDRMMENPEPNPYRQVHVSDAGLAERIYHADDYGWWWSRNYL